MTMNRRNVLIGLGTIVAGGGAALGTGAFSTVEAERDVSVEVADDADAFLSIEVHEDRDTGDGFVVENSDGQRTIVEFDFSGDTDDEGLNDEARTDFHNLVTITNNGTNDVTLDIEARADDGTEVTGLADDAFVPYEGDNPTNEIDEETLTVEGSDTDPDIDVGFRFDTTVGNADTVENIGTILITADETA
ncbi:hypothetical protein ACYJ1Y_05500 [Natrialbaceae archaeon A-gly3]